jgi:hypothetical protein
MNENHPIHGICSRSAYSSSASVVLGRTEQGDVKVGVDRRGKEGDTMMLSAASSSRAEAERRLSAALVATNAPPWRLRRPPQ